MIAAYTREPASLNLGSVALTSRLIKLLDVVDDFDRFGASSLELVAWELDVDPGTIATMWSAAATRGLLEPAGIEPEHGEAVWRLTGDGRAALRESR
jgi:hypothetical protein